MRIRKSQREMTPLETDQRRGFLEAQRRAMAYATVMASFNVEEFGTERMQRLEGREIVARIQELHAMTQFSGDPLALRR